MGTDTCGADLCVHRPGGSFVALQKANAGALTPTESVLEARFISAEGWGCGWVGDEPGSS